MTAISARIPRPPLALTANDGSYRQSAASMRSRISALRFGLSWGLATLTNSTASTERVLLTTTYFLAEMDDATKRDVIHDRLMLDTGRKGDGN